MTITTPTETTVKQESKTAVKMEAGINPLLNAAGWLSLFSAVIWLFLLFRWVTFSQFDWHPFTTELALARWSPFVPYLIYGGLLLIDTIVGIGLLKGIHQARWLGLTRALLAIAGAAVYFIITKDFFGAAIFLAIAGLLLVLQLKSAAWSLAYPAAFFVGLFFLIPMLIVLVVSLGERARLGTVTYPEFSLVHLGVYFDDYFRFFSKIGGEYIYLRIFVRSFWIAVLNTIICLIIGYPFSYWIARQERRYRNVLILLVMIPFWTNFLVRTYAWMIILRDSGLINNFWTITLHGQAVMLADRSPFFTWLAEATANKLPLLFNQPAVMLGLFYGYLPFMVLPLYANLEQVDWSLLEAAADLGANTWQATIRVLLPLTMPGIVAGSVIVFIPSLGAYVTPDLMGGAKVALLGNLLQQQFMTVRDWPFGSAIGFIMMAIMLIATLVYFRTLAKNEALS